MCGAYRSITEREGWYLQGAHRSPQTPVVSETQKYKNINRTWRLGTGDQNTCMCKIGREDTSSEPHPVVSPCYETCVCSQYFHPWDKRELAQHHRDVCLNSF